MEITSKELIKPSSPTPHNAKLHKLSFLDQCLDPFYSPLIFFYQKESSSCSNHHQYCSKISQHLKLSLADALTKFRHLAGRVKGNAYVDCNDSGALLVEARVRSTLLQDVENASVHELSKYLPLEPYAFLNGAPKSDDLPVLAVQISFFKCGGTAVGVCMSHKVADMASLVMFMNYWAALSRGGNIDDPLAEPACDLASQLFPGIDEGFLFPRYQENVAKEELVCKRFLFDKEKLAALKELASTEDFFGLLVKDPTRVEVVSAFVWKQFIQISRAKGDGKSIFLALHAVNLRSRMNNLPSGRNVFGNLSVLAHTSTVTAWGFGDHYQELVWITRSAIRRIKDDKFIKLVQSGVPYLQEIIKSARPLLALQESVDRCRFTSWCRFPVYEVDYGWGKPLSVCTTGFPSKNVVIFMDTRSGDGIELWITMHKDEMAMLPVELLSLETTTYF